MNSGCLSRRNSGSGTSLIKDFKGRAIVHAENQARFVPGHSIHEVGTARRGNDPKTSMLNQFKPAHDVKNLFVVDESGFVSSGCVNPTLTILALALRASNYLIEQYKRGAL